MVFFICDTCGEALKKKQVQVHSFKCKNCKFSCMDCQTVFDRTSYESHIKCITENQKYGGANYVPKVYKGEAKQDAWVQQVRAAIKFVADPQLKNLLRSVQNHVNIPRKEAKFINFLQNSLRVRDRQLCQQAWLAIKVEADKLKLTEAEQKELTRESTGQDQQQNGTDMEEEEEEDGQHNTVKDEVTEQKKNERKKDNEPKEKQEIKKKKKKHISPMLDGGKKEQQSRQAREEERPPKVKSTRIKFKDSSDDED